MKKGFVLVIIVLLLLLSSCREIDYYNRDHPHLFTQITSSLLGTGSYDWRDGETIHIVETDDLGRELFFATSWSDIYLSIAIIGICQKTDEDSVYYYPDISFIFKRTLSTHLPVVDGDISNYVDQHFIGDEIKNLKEKNDWNKPFVDANCIKKEIYRKKPEINEIDGIEKDVKKHYRPYFTMLEQMKTAEFINYLYDNEYISEKEYTKRIEDTSEVEYTDHRIKWDGYKHYRLFITLLTNDIEGSEIYVAVVRDLMKTIKVFMLFYDKDGNLNTQTGAEELSDYYNYVEQLKSFKEKNGFKER